MVPDLCYGNLCSYGRDVVRQDRAYTIGIVLAVVESFERDWKEKGLHMELSKIEACMFFLSGGHERFRGCADGPSGAMI